MMSRVCLANLGKETPRARQAFHFTTGRRHIPYPHLLRPHSGCSRLTKLPEFWSHPPLSGKDSGKHLLIQEEEFGNLCASTLSLDANISRSLVFPSLPKVREDSR